MLQCRKGGGCFQVWIWLLFISVKLWISADIAVNVQKKMNARTKDALDETLILSGK